MTKRSARYPHVVRYINSFLKKHSSLKWSSFAIHKDVLTQTHVDAHNDKQELSLTVTFGDFHGGQMWLHDPEMETRPSVVWKQDSQGRQLTGRLVESR